jgi:hypothetical protein
MVIKEKNIYRIGYWKDILIFNSFALPAFIVYNLEYNGQVILRQ